MRFLKECGTVLSLAAILALAVGCETAQVGGLQEEPSQTAAEMADLGPQSQRARGELRVLMLAVKFPNVTPNFSLDEIKARALDRLNDYVKSQSYGQAWVKSSLVGWVPLPDPIERYAVSPDNFQVDRTRVRKLIEDSMTAVQDRIDFAAYDHMLIIPGAMTSAGKGYGMICYCANPGMLSGVRRKPAYVTLRAKGGKEFSGGVFVGAENSHLGMFAHDFFHALGGVHDDMRLVP